MSAQLSSKYIIKTFTVETVVSQGIYSDFDVHHFLIRANFKFEATFILM